MLSDEYRYKILRLVEENPEISQRGLARLLGISLGKVNYCVQALIETGLIKADNFKNNQHKRAYMYYLTRKGVAAKTTATTTFLKSKLAEYEALRAEIDKLKRESARR